MAKDGYPTKNAKGYREGTSYAISTDPQYPGELSMWDFYNVITNAESIYSDVEDEYKKAREYFENSQKPSWTSKKNTFVQENLSTDLVRNMTGMLVGGDIDMTISGGGKLAKPLKELHNDILERNKFKERHLEAIANRFYVEGKPVVSVDFNPRKKTQYGIGMPEINVYRPDEGLNDPNSQGYLHDDSRFRILKKRVSIKELERRYGEEVAKEIPTYESSILNNQAIVHETEIHTYIYTVEYKYTKFEKDENGVAYEEDCYYMCKIGGRTKMLEEPKETGFKRFTTLIGCHTQREETTTEPIGLMPLVKQKQDMINSTATVMYAAIKADIKNTVTVSGASPSEEAKARKELAKANGFIAFRNVEARVNQLKGSGVSPGLLNFYQWLLLAWDKISGQSAPERGDVYEDMSGKAIMALQQQGIVPEYVSKLHIQKLLSEISMVILECIQIKMKHNEPFSLKRMIDGKEKDIYYNYPIDKLEDMDVDYDDDYHDVDADEGIVNNLLKIDVDEIDISIEVDMNVLGKENNNKNQALLEYQQQLRSRLDTLKVLRPKEYQELYENKMQEDWASNMLNELINIKDEDQKQLVMNGFSKLLQSVQQMEQTEKNGEYA